MLYKRRWLLLFLVGVLLTTTVASTTSTSLAAGQSSDQPGRMIVDPSSDASVTIMNEGDCGDLSITTSTGRLVGAEASEVTSISYSILDDCTVAQIGFAVDTTTNTTVRDSNSTRTAQRSSSCGSWLGNYVHTKHTIQDILQLDVGELRYHTDRKWNDCITQFKADRWESADTWFSWNEVVAVGEAWYQSGTSSSSRSAKAYADFYTDFFACGEEYSLANKHKVYPGGYYSGTFIQQDLCWTAHVNLHSWTSASRNG